MADINTMKAENATKEENDKKTGNVLKIDKSVIYKFKIEKKEELKGSFFHSVYKQAEALLNGIIETKNNKENKKNNKDKEEKDYKNVDNDFNNIIAFVGERGSGKTSSMISFSESLRGKTDYSAEFHLLDMIDPSVFDNKRDSIVEIIVATMFKKFKKKLKENKDIGSYESDKLNLIAQFEKVYKDIKTLNNNKNNIFNESAENIEALVDLASAINMKKDLEVLVKSYLKYMASEGDFLVISIDDLDMNISSGEKMIEEIRKYLVTPQVVILMAIRFPQLEMLVKQKNIKELNTLVEYAEKIDKTKLEKQNENFKDIEAELENKTDKYLEKIIPYNKRIFMPEINVGDVEIEIHLEQLERGKQPITECMAKLYYDYLRYIIVKPAHYHVVVPNTLRELVELIEIFSRMKVVSADNEKKALVENIGLAKKYFSSKLIHKTPDLGMKNLLKEVLDAPLITINKTILLFLNTQLYQRKIVDSSINDCVEEIHEYHRGILEESVNLGDVVTWFKLFNNTNFFIEEKNFNEVLKLIYSLRLIEALYSKEKEILYIIEKDVVGKYFQFIADTRYWKQISDLEIKIKAKNELNVNEAKVALFYELLEPAYDKVKNNRKFKKFYVNHVYTTKAKRGEDEDEEKQLVNYSIKPLNLLGIKDAVYSSNTDKKYTSLSTIYENSYSEININIKDYLIICNMDFYMTLLEEISKNVSEARQPRRQEISKNVSEARQPRRQEITTEIRMKLIYKETMQSINDLCNRCAVLDLKDIWEGYFEMAKECFEKRVSEKNVIDQNEQEKSSTATINQKSSSVSDPSEVSDQKKSIAVTIDQMRTIIDKSKIITEIAELADKYANNTNSIDDIQIPIDEVKRSSSWLRRFVRNSRKYFLDETNNKKYNILGRFKSMEKSYPSVNQKYITEINNLKKCVEQLENLKKAGSVIQEDNRSVIEMNNILKGILNSLKHESVQESDN
jgi:hypothetical protein